MEATHRQTRIPKTPCRFFLQGKCNYGKNCRSSHDVATTTTRSDIESKDRKQKNKKHEPDPAYAAWRLLLRLRRPLSEQEMSQFFASTLTLVSADEAQLMYETVAALASEDGLSRIGRLTSTSLSDMAPAPRIAYFTKTVLPFCQAITTPRVLSSLINEIQIGTIYNFLLGVGGTRSIPFFHGIAITLFDIKFAAETTEVTDELVPESLAAVLTTLAQLFERNQTAPMLEDLQVVVKDITACMGEADEHAMSSPHMQTAFRSLSRIQVKLGWAKSITVWEKPTSILNGGPPIFDIQEDPPGQLSPKGQRHDNDHEDIEKIRIMPTAEEILSERPEYLPVSEPSRLHYPGMRGLIDRHFRLVREDTVGPMRDSVRLVIASLRQDPEQLGSTSDRTPHSGRVLVFKNATVTSLSFDKLKGLQISAEFDQPNSVKKLKKPKDRQDWWQDSKQLTIDSLVCLVDSTGGSIFLSVSDKPPEKSDEKYKSNGTQAEVAELIEARSWRRQDSTDIESAKSSTSLWDNRLRASVRMQLVDHDLNIERALARFEEQTRKQPKMTQQLVGFPGVLLPSFSPTLKALQEMSRSHVFPFTDFIATDQSEALLDVPAPSYSLQAGFNFNLSCIMDGARNMLLSPRDRFSMPALTGNSMLDPAQCESLVAALSRSLALIQGPPGTGKSYVAVQMVKILLEQRLQGDIGPIICMQFLEHLIRDGVEQIIRIGSRSASEMLKSVNLREVSQHIDRTKTEKTREWECHRALETTAGNVDNMLESLQRVKDPLALRQYLEQHHVRHCHELFADDEDGWETVHHGQNKYEYALEAWLGAQPAEQHIHTQDRSVARISQLPLPSLSKKERWKLYNDWIATMRSQIHEGLMDVLRTYEEEKLDLDRCRREKDLHCLEKAQLIGLTTTGLARHLDTLKRLPSKILICEEAGEVLEAHLLTALQLPHIEHTILIGDHEQLRPQIQNHDLSIENHKTMEKYALDVSMFERLVKPYLPGQPSVPYSTLRMQRRMHPSISQLIRMTLYPNLLDHPDMIDYPGVSGLKERLYWLDHREREVQPDPSQPLQVSRSNDFEVDMVAAIVSHLFRQGAYQDEEIAVLTPYVRQLQKIRERLSASHEIVVGERDLEELDKAGLEEPGTMATNIATTAVTSSVQRTTLLKALRVATIDNFQGEEAKVIIISLVRSNDQRNCGFLKTSNRINVLLSRAKHGMVIIGNSDTSQHVPMWNKVINLLRDHSLISMTLPLSCPRHPEKIIQVSKPDDFLSFAPEGGCNLQCNNRLRCGHNCTLKCHAKYLHDAVVCLEPCPRPLPGCDHPCPGKCGHPCNLFCKVLIKEVPLPCQHTAKQLKCHEVQNIAKVKCGERVQKLVFGCNHSIDVECHINTSSLNFRCKETCGAVLPCGHSCQRKCLECRPRDVDYGLQPKALHGQCTNVCGRHFNTCSHSCSAFCHGEEPCPLCDRPCANSCVHSRCNKSCKEPCVPCAMNCTSGCLHQGKCSLPCAVPCDLNPCSKRCDNNLGCGHRCPSVCGEVCPSIVYCQICASEDVKNTVVDYIMSSTYGEVDLAETPCLFPRCGHILTLESMDGHMDMPKFYEMDSGGCVIATKGDTGPFSSEDIKVCPMCRGALHDIQRYNRIVKRGMIDEATKKFFVWSNQKFLPLEAKLQEEELRLQGLGTKATNADVTRLNCSINLAGSWANQIAQINGILGKANRYKITIKLRQEISNYLHTVSEAEQPFSKVFQLVENTRRRYQTKTTFTLDSSVLQVRGRLLATVLSLRCDLAILSDFLQFRSAHAVQTPLAQESTFDFSVNRLLCIQLFDDAAKKDQPMHQVEACVFFARFVALERSSPAGGMEIMTNLLAEAREKLTLAKGVCQRAPSTLSMLPEIEDTEKLLRDSTFYTTFTNDEKRAVYAAMATELRGTGHWYYCENMHPFTVGECGMPMQQARCPQCGAPVGGQNHTAAQGVRPAADFEAEFGRLRV